MLVQGVQRPLAQQAAAFGSGDKVTNELGAALGRVALAQDFHGFPVGIVQAGQRPGRAADADAAVFAQDAGGHLGNFVGQNVQVLVKIGGIAQQYRDDLARRKKADAAQVFGGQRVHRPHKGGSGAVGAVLVQQS